MIGAGIGIGAALWAGSSSGTPVADTVAPSQALGGASGSETPYPVSGKTNPDSGHPSIHDVNCPSGQYIEAGPNSRGTVFDSPRIDLNIPPGVLSTFQVKSSVEWGHIGSRLATAIELGFQNKSLYPNPEPYAATVYCTSDQGAAWVILG
jgi:hypothetical protein